MKPDYLSFANTLAKQGGEILRRHFGKLKLSDIQSKGVHDVVTTVDRQVEKFYTRAIRKAFPEHGIIGEEGTSVAPKKEWVWLLDPLDGTKNYTIQNPFFCTMICLLHNGEPVVSSIYEPITDHLYWAEKGKGAFMNGKRMRVSKLTDLKKAMVLYCHAADAKAIKEAEHYVVRLKLAARDAARLRSAGCEMALIAKGACEAYTMNKLPLWDLAAGALLVREAGGKATDFKNKDWKPGDSNILVSNGTNIHTAMLRLLKA